MASRKPRGLGRGLGALIRTPPPRAAAGAPGTEPDEIGAPLYIPIARIAPNPSQPRKRFEQSELDGLAASIREQGVLQPLVVRARGDGYELIIGERRWRAAQLAGLAELPAVVLDASDRAVVEMALVENVQRADLNPMELAQAFRALIDDEGMTQEEVGRRVGLDRSTVANHLRLLELPGAIQQDLIDCSLTLGHAKAILQAPAEQRMMVRDQIVRGGLNVRAAEEMSRRAASDGAKMRSRPGPSRDVEVVALEDRLRQQLRTKIRIVGRLDRGRIELHYFGAAELERLTETLTRGEP